MSRNRMRWKISDADHFYREDTPGCGDGLRIQYILGGPEPLKELQSRGGWYPEEIPVSVSLSRRKIVHDGSMEL